MQPDLFRDYRPALALRRYRTAAPGYKLRRRREWIMETARSLVA